MASISKDKNGTKRVVFIDVNRDRHYIRLGKIDMKAASTIKTYIEKLVAAQVMNVAPDAETAQWVANLPDESHVKLAKTGLIAERRKVGTLGEVIPTIIANRAATVSEQTIEIWKQSEESLYRFFGKDRRVGTITHEDAESFRSWLVSDGRLDGKGGLKSTTVWKRLQHVVAFFKSIVKNKGIATSPFEGMSMDPAPDEDRNDYIEEKFIREVMKVAPDAEWRLIIALWRFAGLRGSSEPLLLRWKDIHWEKNRITVHSRKTERYAGKKIRVIPLFPELIEPLRAARLEANKNDVYVITKHAPRYLKNVPDRSKLKKIKANLGSIFGKFVRKTGNTPWPKIINNIRASWISDLLDGKYQNAGTPFGIQTIAKWAGNSPKVILRYYGRIRPQVYDQVTQFNEQIKSESPLKGFFGSETPENTEPNAPLGVAQKASQYTAEMGNTERQDTSEEFGPYSPNPFDLQHLAARNGKGRHLTETSQITRAERTGFEPAEPLRVHGFSKPAH